MPDNYTSDSVTRGPAGPAIGLIPIEHHEHTDVGVDLGGAAGARALQ